MGIIEHRFPVEELNPVALNEGNAKKPIYRMHKWWARRLGSVFRSILLSVFGERDDTAKDIWQKFCEGFDLKGKIVLDPFMGGGTTMVEALRLGCKVIGVDINPVAWFVTKKEAEMVNLEQLDDTFRFLESTVGERIKSCYRTTDPRGNEADVMYFFWVKVAQCKKCGLKTELFSNYELSRTDSINTCVCPNCHCIIETQGYNSKTKCKECHSVFDPRKGVSKRGLFQCTHCGVGQKSLDAVESKGTALDLELYALEGYSKQYGRFFKRIDGDDLSRFALAKKQFDVAKNDMMFPNQAIPTEGRSDPRPVNHGYTNYWNMFNERQLLSLSMLYKTILQIEDQNIREIMLLALSDSLNTNNMFCKYEVEWHKISLFFSLHAFHPIERPAENNVWGAAFGRGTFVKCFEKIRQAKVFSQRPYERLIDLSGEKFTNHTKGEKIEGQIVSCFSELDRIDHAALLRCQSSENLSFIPDKSVDAVITDPPYFDNLQYSELADFFYVWLRLGLKKDYPWFEPETSNSANELVKNDKFGKTTEFFNQGICRVFGECHRVLKDDGLLVFSFHHNKVWAWEGMAKLLLDAGFYIAEMPIVRSEGRGEVHSSEGNIKYDGIFVCCKSPSKVRYTNWPSLKKSILADSVTWAKRTLKSGMLMNDVDIFTIMMGKTIEYYTQIASNSKNGKLIPSLPDALNEIAGLVNYLSSMVKREGNGLPKKYAQKMEQLRLIVSESKKKYGAKVKVDA